MPRIAMLDAPGVLDHTMGRGIEKQRIFLNDQDRVEFINRLADLVKEGMLALLRYRVAFFRKQRG